jgi:hypothetical protein
MGPMGFTFGTLTERFFDWVLDRDKKAFEGIARQFFDQVVPPLMPSLAEPAVDHLSERTNLFQRRLVPASLEKASGYMEYTHDTSETAKAITKLLGPIGYDLIDASPIIIENYARKWLGTVPMEFGKVVEGFWKERTKPHEGIADTPFLRSFFMRRPMGGQIVNDYYNEFEAFTARKADLRLAIQRGDLSLVNEPGQFMAAAKLTTYHRALAEHRAAIEATYNNKDMTDIEKIKQTDALASGYVAIAKAGLEAMRMIRGGARGE